MSDKPIKLSVVLDNIPSVDLVRLAKENINKIPNLSLSERGRGFSLEEVGEIPSYVSPDQMLDLVGAREVLLAADWKKTEGGNYKATVTPKSNGVNGFVEEMLATAGECQTRHTASATEYTITPEAKDKIASLAFIHEVGNVLKR